jgi:hypothetical protein
MKAKSDMAYRIPDADELVDINNWGRLEVERGRSDCSRNAGRRYNRNHRLGDGLVLGRARHGFFDAITRMVEDLALLEAWK